MGRMAFWPTCGHRSVDQGYTSRFTALNPLRSSLSDSHLPSVPVSVNQAYRNGSHTPLPATRANPQCCRHSVACRSVGQATDRDRTVYARPNTKRLAGNPRRQQGRGPKDRRTPADTAHAVVGEDLNTKAGTASAKGTGTEPGRNLNTKAGTASAKGTGTEPGRNLKRKAGRYRSLPARGGRGPERKPAPQGRGAGHGEPGACFTNRQPVRSRPQNPPTVADTICVWPAGSRPTPAAVGGDLDSGAGGAFLWGPLRGAGKGLPHGQGAISVGDPRDP